ncbi:4-aminobutyrate aminotransferase PuuE [Rhodovastum atsumiense]|uniref:4-aminobutyrate--2-oxoglutarate transaminase n=1 Tax=Rhodovastum atsumiense TaxID=504468 RepID=A0A5M6IRE5_9PROT|nr:4-aminobutyrate--2-oxoglutarate transaminase [Rhodovastum atsumiense]KAA5610045.1 4-aminobutyrate--2-oxoglutarate transaminase [Rhodovastum atsumiense]CAH2602962.1 4-aminobutyrate aminotransferase PuuE [Rhodovastum atsumiense]
MNANLSLQTRRERAVPAGLSTNLPIYAARAQNAEIWDADGKRYIDFASGIAAVATGHRHPKVVAAVREQLDHFAHVCIQVTPYEPYVALAEKLNGLMPGPGEKRTLFVTTGAEAVENAVKIARIATGRPGVVAFTGAFHGRTLLTVALTGKVAPYKLGVAPLPGEIYHVPFPDAYHGVSVEQSLQALDTLFRADIDPARVAAIIIEPVQGEGGFNPAPADFMQALRKVCDRHGILLIVDEIQTGFGRTGKLFAVEHSGVAPDLMTVAKSLGGGFPISGVIGRAEVMDKPKVGAIGGTYGGNPMSCAAGLAVLDVIAEEKLVERAGTLGGIIGGRLRAMAQRNEFSCIGDVRGLGAMLAMELVKDRVTREPAPELTKKLVARAAEKGLLILSCGVWGNAIRFLPPLTIPEAQLIEGLDILEASLAELVA